MSLWRADLAESVDDEAVTPGQVSVYVRAGERTQADEFVLDDASHVSDRVRPSSGPRIAHLVHDRRT